MLDLPKKPDLIEAVAEIIVNTDSNPGFSERAAIQILSAIFDRLAGEAEIRKRAGL